MAAPNTSASGGYIQPQPIPAPQPLVGAKLDDFIQEFIVGLTGLDRTLVRPAWQANPANIPAASTAWAAFNIQNIPADDYPAIIHHPGDDQTGGYDELQRHEQLQVLVSFYDLGSDGKADDLASLLRDNLAMPQNLEILTQNNMGLMSTGAQITVPVLLKERWLNRVDLPFVLNHEIIRTYAVENVLSAHATLVTDEGIVVEINANPSEPAP